MTTLAYAQAGNPAFEAELTHRTASQEAAFFVPHLQPGMKLLDAGCGPGTITIDLAERVTPGKTIGIDIQPTQIEQTQALATERGITTVEVAVADVYDLPFPDNSFDAAFAHGVLMHLREPRRALSELHRVLRPNGILGVRDPDWGASCFCVPTTSLLETFQAIRVQRRQYLGNDVLIGRHHRRLMLEAGFVWTEAGASVDSAGTPEQLYKRATFFKAVLQGITQAALQEGWTDQSTVDAIATELDTWALRPDAFSAIMWCETLGWVST